MNLETRLRRLTTYTFCWPPHLDDETRAHLIDREVRAIARILRRHGQYDDDESTTWCDFANTLIDVSQTH